MDALKADIASFDNFAFLSPHQGHASRVIMLDHFGVQLW